MAPPSLPVEVWLLVFAKLNDLNFLWSTCRTVSRFLRDCVDDFFRHGVMRNTLIDLHYSDIHTRPGPQHSYIHVPMVFDRFFADGSKAVFQQRVYKEIDGCHCRGSVRGWVPFIERYCNETRSEKPEIMNKSKADARAPLWEREHEQWRNILQGEAKHKYVLNMGNMTSIARGDRPPFYIKVYDLVNDTELVDLAVDCERREISFDWRQTYAMFFRERNFAARAYNQPGEKRAYDEELEVAATRYSHQQNKYNDAVRARRKRLQTWTAQNKHRMSSEIRLSTEERVYEEQFRLQRFLLHANLEPLPENGVYTETVPARLADDHADLLFWPFVNNNGYHVSADRSHVFGVDCCTIL